jgi:hypothetical protein
VDSSIWPFVVEFEVLKAVKYVPFSFDAVGCRELGCVTEERDNKSRAVEPCLKWAKDI